MIDLHMHTTFSDGKNSIEEMIIMAESIGLKTIAITDHIWKSSNWFDNYFDEIILLKEKYKTTEILAGFEAKALSTNGEIDATRNMCKKANIRLGAIHRIPKSKDSEEFFLRNEVIEDKFLSYSNWLITTQNMIKNTNVDIIAHPCMVLDKYNIEPNINDIFDLLLLAKKYNTKLEISSRYKKSNMYLLNVLKTNPNLLSIISYGSDSHSIDDLKKAHSEK